MSNNPIADASMRSAIELMTAWNADPDAADNWMSQQVTTILLEHPTPEEGLVHLVTGLGNLAGRLLIRIEAITGEPASKVLQEFALQHSVRDIEPPPQD